MTQRNFIPGDTWLYIKIYAGPSFLQRLLIKEIYELIELSKNLISSFFFIRYADPSPHLRVRMKVKNDQSYIEIFKLVRKYFSQYLEEKLISNIQIDTYTRELERYGENTIEETESFFCVDSKYILRLIRNIDYRTDEHFLISLILIDDILNVFKFVNSEKIKILKDMSASYKQEFCFYHHTFTKQLNDKYRNRYKDIEKIFYRNIPTEILQMLNDRKASLSTISNKLLSVNMNIEDYCKSIIHMSMNRWFVDSQRLYELVIYNFLYKLYQSQYRL